MTAPGTIWAEELEIFDCMGFWQERQRAGWTEYTRTDTIPDPLDDPRVVALVEAAEPFFTYAQSNVDENGWTLGTGSERICDWFGPSDFLALIAALSTITKEPPHER